MDQDIIPMSPGTPPIEVVNPMVSIVIPTFNHLDLLQACVKSIQEYTDLSTCEVVIVANGCADGTHDYLKTLPAPFRHVVSPDPLGYTAATNAGIRVARGHYVVLLNNDVVLLEQKKNAWIEMLLAAFRRDPKTGITGPVKFFWDCGGIERRAVAFWCAMIPRTLFSELGLLDEIFSPGMGEDGDFCIKAETAGYRLVQVPKDGQSKFGEGVPAENGFPIYHIGSATFGEKDYSGIQKRNTQILVERYGRKDHLETIYEQAKYHRCDVNELFEVFRYFSSKSSHVTEFGTRGVMSTWAFLAARPKRMLTYDIEYNANIEGAKKEAALAGISFEFRLENTLEAEIEPTDLLFIDTTHTYVHLKTELERHAGKVAKYLLIHDTETFGLVGADGGPGEKQAISEFLAVHPEWFQREHIEISNGLTVLERRALLCSIVIPTCGKDWNSVLATCLKLVFQFTDLSDKEVIVVANGAPSEALEHLRTLPVRVLEFPERLGYIRAVNEGIRAAKSSHAVLLDDDSFLMPQDKDTWIRMLVKPFIEDAKMAAAGPFGQVYEDLGQVLHSGCTMYRKDVLEEIGLFDEAFNPGYMGDEDLAIRIRKAGYRIVRVPEGPEPKYVNGVFEIQFPVLHTGTVNTMDKHGQDLPLVKKNRDLLYERHGKKPEEVAGPSGGVCPIGPPGPVGEAGKAARPTISIVIPTAFAKLEELLRPNIESILQYTDMEGIEVIVVANGCTDSTEDYVRSLGPRFKLLSFPDAMGYTRATNEGIKVATGEYLVFYNNDNVLLPQPKNDWVEKLLFPFRGDPKMGVTGPLQLHDDYADADVIIGFCLCIPRKVLSDAMAHTGGLLDEVYSPGGGEDIDLCCRVKEKGYKIRQVPQDGIQGKSNQNTGDFMIWHRNNQTFKDMDEYTRFIIKRNGLVNLKKYNKNIKLNLGSGGIEYPGYLSVDLHDRRANIIMDITKLDFPENSVSEMLAIHVIEHISPYIVLDTLKLWNRILKPGGKLTMELPDLESLCERYVKANTGTRYGLANCIYGSVNTTGEGTPADITSPHLFGWDKQQIHDQLWNAGFVNIQFMPERFPHPEPPNMSVDAYKPGP